MSFRKVGKLFKSLVVLAILAAVVFAYATGMLSWEDTRSHVWAAAGNAKAAVVGGGGPGVSGAKASPSAAACATKCRQNLALLQSVKKSLESRSGIAQGTIGWNEVLKAMKGKPRPVCPCGGEYSLGTLEQNVSCTLGANGTSDPADDHTLRNF